MSLSNSNLQSRLTSENLSCTVRCMTLTFNRLCCSASTQRVALWNVRLSRQL